MKFEHVALNVPEPLAMARWYVENLGLTVVRKAEGAARHIHFLGDDTGRVFLELYSNPVAPYPDYAAAHPQVLHVAFYTPDAAAVQQRLVAAGAKPFSDDRLEDGTRLIVVRCPWGVALQLAQRAKPFPGF
ncbi:MAG: VOC family protein [Opitutae bacterium]|nr:VOC family protein [Opitutae bacterium]